MRKKEIEKARQKKDWLKQLEKMLKNRNPIQGQILHPLQVYGPCKGNIFLKNLIDEINISIGDFTYAHMEHLEGEKVLKSLVPYSFGDKRLMIGKFCSIGSGTQFISPYANHQIDSFTTYPFWHIFSKRSNIKPWVEQAQSKGDTIIENDVWLGRECMVLPGIHIGNGAIVAARTVVSQNVPHYGIVAGNPSKIIRYRFSDEIIQELLTIQWWNWPIKKIIRYHSVLMGGDMEKLKSIANSSQKSK